MGGSSVKSQYDKKKTARILAIYDQIIRGEIVNKQKWAEEQKVTDKTIQRHLQEILQPRAQRVDPRRPGLYVRRLRRQPLHQVITGFGRHRRQVVERGPRPFRVDVVGGQRRNAAPVVAPIAAPPSFCQPPSGRPE